MKTAFPKTLEWYFSVISELGHTAAVTTSYTGNDHCAEILCMPGHLPDYELCAEPQNLLEGKTPTVC